MVPDPVEAMDLRAAEWGKIWITQDSEWPLIVHLLEQAYDVACTQHAQPPTYTPEDIKRIIRCTNIHKGFGADGVTAGFLKFLPEEGYTQIYDLFVQMDTCVMPPAQMLYTIIALIGKPDGGERPIGLLSLLYRVYMKLHRVEVAHWEKIPRPSGTKQ